MLKPALLSAALLLVLGCAPRSTQQASVLQDCRDCPPMQQIPAGSFEMGAADDDAAAKPDEKPRHRVIIEKPFAIGVHEVTRAEFEAFVEATGHDAGDRCFGYEVGHWNGKWDEAVGRTWRTPGYEQTPNDPVVCVNWNDANRYANWLSERTGKHYRLPTEAEWEYVARLANPLSAGDDGLNGLTHDKANYGAEAHCCTALASGKDRWLQSAPVGSFEADAMGLYDLRGNVWEWLADCYHDRYDGAPVDGSARTSGCSRPDRRVTRGGSWGDPARLLRLSYRLRSPLEGRYFTLGFRVARDGD